MTILGLRTTVLKGLILAMLFAAPAYAGVTYSSAAAEATAIVGLGRFTTMQVYGTNSTATAGFLAILDASAVPITGAAIVPKDCIALPANSTASIKYDAPSTLYQTGIVVALTSAANCFTFTGGTITGFIKGYAQ